MSDDERESVESSIGDALSERCGCLFSQDYIVNGQFMCSDGPSANTVEFQGRLIGTQNADSVELLFHLLEWLLTEPTVAVGGVSLQTTGNCRVYYNKRGNTTHSTPCEWPSRKYREAQQSITGAAVSAGYLALVAIMALGIVVVMCFCQRYKIPRKLSKKSMGYQPAAAEVASAVCEGKEGAYVEIKQNSESMRSQADKNVYQPAIPLKLLRVGEEGREETAEVAISEVTVCEGEEDAYVEMKHDLVLDSQSGEHVYQPLVSPAPGRGGGG